jgi:hypothetical protein
MLLDRDHSIGATDFIGMNFGYAAGAAIGGDGLYFRIRPEAEIQFGTLAVVGTAAVLRKKLQTDVRIMVRQFPLATTHNINHLA